MQVIQFSALDMQTVHDVDMATPRIGVRKHRSRSGGADDGYGFLAHAAVSFRVARGSWRTGLG